MPTKTELYKQCMLARNNHYWMAWLPERLCKVGKVVIPKDEEPAVVEEVYNRVLTHSQIIAASQYYKTHRDGSDI